MVPTEPEETKEPGRRAVPAVLARLLAYGIGSGRPGGPRLG
jgi:hypothetical protein